MSSDKLRLEKFTKKTLKSVQQRYKEALAGHKSLVANINSSHRNEVQRLTAEVQRLKAEVQRLKATTKQTTPDSHSKKWKVYWSILLIMGVGTKDANHTSITKGITKNRQVHTLQPQAKAL